MPTHIFAHRGNRVGAPENTLAAFAQVMDTGAEGVEFDVHLSRDGVPVVIHDETLDRTTGGTGRVGAFTHQELRALDAGGWFGEEFKGQHIPALDEVLALYQQSHHVLNVELKTTVEPYPGLVEAVIACIRARGLADRTILSSFNHHSLRQAGMQAPEIPCAALVLAHLIDPWDYVRAHGFQALHVEHHGCSAELVTRCHEAGLAVRAYTVVEEADARRLLAMEVDGIVTDCPAPMVALRERLAR